jgi:hypothetical protein
MSYALEATLDSGPVGGKMIVTVQVPEHVAASEECKAAVRRSGNTLAWNAYDYLASSGQIEAL